MTVDDEVSTHILARLHRRIVANYAHHSATILFVAELGRGLVSMAVFTDHRRHIGYHCPDFSFYLDVLLAHRQRLPAAQQWEEIHFFVEGSQFEATFAYPEDFDPDVHLADYWCRILRRHFGGKAVDVTPEDELRIELLD